MEQDAFSEKLLLITVSQYKQCTQSSHRLYCDHVKALKQQLRQYDIDLFAFCPLKDITAVRELPNDLSKDLFDANIGDKK